MAYMAETDIIIELADAVKCLGFEQVLELLKSARKSKEYIEETNRILAIICEVIQVNEDVIREKNLRDDKRKVAIGFTIYFTKKVYGYTYAQIRKAIRVNMGYQIMNRYHNIIQHSKMVNPKCEIDRIVADNYEKIYSRIKQQTIKN